MFKAPETWKDWSLLLSSWATGVAIFLKAAFGWPLEQYISPFVIVIMLTIFLVWNLYGVWKNTHVSKKAQLQKKALQAQGLMKK